MTKTLPVNLISSPTNYQQLKQILLTFLRVILTIFAILCSPILFLAYGFLFLYRLLVSKTARYFDPKLGKMVSSMSSIFAAHDVYGNSYTSNIALHVVGEVDRLHLIHSMENLLTSSVTPEGTLQYPEMTQNIVTKLGYKFWRNLDNFQVDNHITYLNPEDPDTPVTLQELRDTIARFGNTPLNPTRSPWQILVIRKFNNCTRPEVKSAIIFRLHHAMFDGYSILNVLSKLADNGPFELGGQHKMKEQLESFQSSVEGQGCLRSFLRAILVVVLGPYELIGQLLSYDDNELTRTCKRDFKKVMKMHECEPMKLEDLKQIKNFYRVSLVSLLNTLGVRALKRFMEKRKISTEKIHMTFPLPVLNHPDKLRNYFSGGMISFDVTHDDPLKLLKAVEQKYHKFRFAYAVGLPKLSMLLLRIFGSLPIWFTPNLDNVPLCSTIIHSTFPGPVQMGYFCGFPVVDATVSGSISRTYPIGILGHSYTGYYKYNVMADSSIFSSEGDAEEMGNYIYDEFLQFYRQVQECLV